MSPAFIIILFFAAIIIVGNLISKTIRSATKATFSQKANNTLNENIKTIEYVNQSIYSCLKTTLNQIGSELNLNIVGEDLFCMFKEDFVKKAVNDDASMQVIIICIKDRINNIEKNAKISKVDLDNVNKLVERLEKTLYILVRDKSSIINFFKQFSIDERILRIGSLFDSIMQNNEFSSAITIDAK